MSKKNNKLYINDIIQAIHKIEKYTKVLNYSKFARDEKTIDAVIRNLSIIGEAANNIPAEIRKKYPLVPWRQTSSMRNKVIHEYFGINKEIIWKTVTEDIPLLKKEINKIKSNQ